MRTTIKNSSVSMHSRQGTLLARALRAVSVLVLTAASACAGAGQGGEDDSFVVAEAEAALSDGSARASLIQMGESSSFGLELTIRDAAGETTMSYDAKDDLALELDPTIAHALSVAAAQQTDVYATALAQVLSIESPSHYRLRKGFDECYARFRCGGGLDCMGKAWDFCGCVYEEDRSTLDCASILLP